MTGRGCVAVMQAALAAQLPGFERRSAAAADGLLREQKRKQDERLAEVERLLKELQASTGWRMTGPLRRIAGTQRHRR